MKKQSMRRIGAVVMSVVLLLTTVFAAMPTMLVAQAAETVPASANILPTNATVSGNGSVSATAHALSITTKGTTAVTATLTGASFYLDADGFNALSLSVNTAAATSLTLNLTSSEGTKSITTADLGGEAYVSGGKIPAGDYSELVLDMAKMTSWDGVQVTLSSITVQTSAATTVVFYGMEATAKESQGSTSLMSGTRTIGKIEGNAYETLATDLADGGVQLRVDYPSTVTDQQHVGYVRYTYAAPMEIHTYDNVYTDQLYYSFNVASGKKAKLVLNIYNYTTSEWADVPFSSLIDSTLSNSAAITSAQHYEGTISFKDIAAACGFVAVQDGILKIQYAQMYLEGSLHELTLIQSDVHNTPVSLMPSVETAKSLGLSYDTNGFLTYTATKAGTVTIPVGKYVDIKVLQYMDAVVTADLNSTPSGNNFGWDIGFIGTGVKADGTTLLKTTTLWNDWGQTEGTQTEPANQWNAPQKSDQNKLDVNQKFTGSLTWAGMSLDARIYYVESIVLKLGVAGTLKVRDFSFVDTASYTAAKPIAPALSLGELQGEPGETVNVELVLNSATGIMNFDASIVFDNTYLSIDKSAIVWNTAMLGNSLDAEPNTATTTGFHVANIVNSNTLKLAYIGNDANTAASGVIATIPVTIAANAPAGVYQLDMTVGDVAVYSTEYGSSPYYEVLYDNVETTDGSIAIASANAQPPVIVTVGSGNVFSGKTVPIPVSISEGHYVKSGTVRITYDATALSITPSNVAFSAGYRGTVTVAGGVITVVLNNTATTADAGTMFTLNFTAAEDTDREVTLNATVSNFTAAQGAATYALPATDVDGTVTVSAVDAASQTINFTAVPSADTFDKNEFVRVDIQMSANKPVVAFDLQLSFDAAKMTPVPQSGNGYVAWTTTAGVTASEYSASSGTVTLSYMGSAAAMLESGTVGSVYFVLNTAADDVAVTLTNGTGDELLYIPDAPNADTSGLVKTAFVNCYGGAFRVGTTTTTTTTTTMPAVGASEVQFVTVSSSNVVATEQTITVDILLNSPKGVQNFGLLLKADPDVLTPVKQNGSWVTWNTETLGADNLDSTTNPATYISNYTASTGNLYMSYVAAGVNSAPQGVVGTITFKVNADAVGSTVPSVQTSLILSCTEATWNDPDSSAADDYGDVTPSILTGSSEVLTVYHSQKVEYYDSTQTLLLETKYFPVGIEVAYDQLEGVNTDKLNYAFLGWQQFEASADTIKMYPAYGYTIEVVGGALSSKYTAQWVNDGRTKAHFSNVRTDFEGYTGLFGYDNHAQVIADEAPAGKVFSHWTDQFGNIVSYDATYTFYVPANLLLVAHYSASAPVQTPHAALQTLRSETANGKTSMTWVCATATATDYTITEIGIILSPQANYNTLTNPDEKQAITLAAKDGRSQDSWQYSITVNNVSANKARYAVAYVKYTDANGKSGVSYSVNFMGMIAPAQ